MQMASSANRTWRLFRSASEYTATVLMPRSLQAQITRTAISPRLAMRIFSNMSARTNREQGFAVLHSAAVLHQLGHDSTGDLRLDFVHQLHRFDDAQHLARLNGITHLNERWVARLGAFVESPDDRALHDYFVDGGRRYSGRIRNRSGLPRGVRGIRRMPGHVPGNRNVLHGSHRPANTHAVVAPLQLQLAHP